MLAVGCVEGDRILNRWVFLAFQDTLSPKGNRYAFRLLNWFKIFIVLCTVVFLLLK